MAESDEKRRSPRLKRRDGEEDEPFRPRSATAPSSKKPRSLPETSAEFLEIVSYALQNQLVPEGLHAKFRKALEHHQKGLVAFSACELSHLEKFGVKLRRSAAWDIPSGTHVRPEDLVQHLAKLTRVWTYMSEATNRTKIDAYLASALDVVHGLQCWGEVPFVAHLDETEQEPGFTGLWGRADFVICGETLNFKPGLPFVTIVEAKKEWPGGAQFQLLAAVAAGRRLNQGRTKVNVCYGILTNGLNWQFWKVDETGMASATPLVSESDLPDKVFDRLVSVLFEAKSLLL